LQQCFINMSNENRQQKGYSWGKNMKPYKQWTKAQLREVKHKHMVLPCCILVLEEEKKLYRKVGFCQSLTRIPEKNERKFKGGHPVVCVR
jgi:hypothetical protein